MRNRVRLTALAALASLAACGTTSNIKPAATMPTSTTAKAPTATAAPAAAAARVATVNAPTATPTQKAKVTLDLSGYDRVVVLDFQDATDKSKLASDKARAYGDTVATAVRTFPELIAQKIRDTGAFQEVVRTASAGKALRVSGRITRLTEGSGTLRLLVGFGAGSSYFEAVTELTDAESNQALGELATDKNSWALGGGLAATQTVQSFMQGAAKRIAAQLSAAKKPTRVVQIR